MPRPRPYAGIFNGRFYSGLATRIGPFVVGISARSGQPWVKLSARRLLRGPPRRRRPRARRDDYPDWMPVSPVTMLKIALGIAFAILVIAANH
jgi:hypothetical protein